MILFTSFISGIFMNPVIRIISIASANPGDVNETWLNTSTITVEVTQAVPVINWYDFEIASTSTSKLNEKIDVNTQVKFVINITHNNGWSVIDYINITMWYDEGNDTLYNSYSTHNTSKPGKCFNIFLQYENTTGTASYKLIWPTSQEVTIGTMTETVISSTTHNITLPFTPLSQIRNAPGPGSNFSLWNTTEGFNDGRTWNFNITVHSTTGDVYKENEFGIYTYTAISSAASPTMSGAPGTTATDALTRDIVYSTNANFSLGVAISGDLVNGSNTISKTNVEVQSTTSDSDIYNTWTAFPNSNPSFVMIYQATHTYPTNTTSGNSKTTSLQYRCNIPLGTPTGNYTAELHYNLTAFW
ncbi:hypothetical protein DRZ77_03400 [Candidatus Woesearchaeota archaeon]|nr:MAG: hypothetical protein DRZ77_03400 [Candidatus Woesearchaeota archaeon]